MPSKFIEDSYEQTLISLFRDQLGYEYLHGPEVERDYRQPYHREALKDALQQVNPDLKSDVLEEAYRQLTHIEEGGLIPNNEQFMHYLQNGMEVRGKGQDGEERTWLVRLVDYEHVNRNSFIIANQWRVEDLSNIRCDLVVLVNGLPLVVMELKSPSAEGVSEHDAYLQIRNYLHKAPTLFTYNAFCVTSDMHSTHAGTITSPEERFMEWKTKDGRYETTDKVHYDTFFEGIFPKERLLNILHNYILFDKREGAVSKILAGYHQYFAVDRALACTYRAMQGDGKIGVFWHTQGSGKSLSMVFLAHLLVQHFSESTIVVVTDRNDLDTQLFGQFSRCKDFLRQTPQQADSRQDLRNMLLDRKAGGILFTTIQKFEEYTDDNGADTALLSTRRNIIVMTDEAHRSQYGDLTWDSKQMRMHKGYSRIMREALPNASFIGFTGTPVSTRDKDTQEVFGEYIDIYDMTQAVRDHATVPVYYESRAIRLKLDPAVLAQLDNEFEALAEEGATPEQLEKSKRDYSQLEAVLGADETIFSLVQDIVVHYGSFRQEEGQPNKALIVAYNRRIAMKIYEYILMRRPDWQNKVKVVMTASNQDPEEWHDIVGNDTYKQNLAAEFKKDDSEFKIAIVVDMWLTGFDVPSLNTMYVYKPMVGHNLMQAIARVNRVYPGKQGGLVVDYIGIANALKQAMKDYTARDRKQFGNPDIEKTALVTFREKMEICCDLLHGFDFGGFHQGDNTTKAQLIQGGINFLLDPTREEKMKNFMRESALLHNAQTLCRSLLTEEQIFTVAFFDAVRIGLEKFVQDGPKVTKREINERIASLLQHSVKSEGVVLFSDHKFDFGIFDEAFLKQVRNMKEKNLAVKILENLIKGIIGGYKHCNLVQAQKFSDLLSDSLSSYLKGVLSNEEVINELIKLAHQIKESEAAGNELGLNREEKAFYDALTQPEAVRQAYTDEQFIALTKELTETLRKNRTIDWNQKESARAQMRRMVKHLLKKYDYPPEGQEAALVVVMEQCNLWTESDYEQ